MKKLTLDYMDKLEKEFTLNDYNGIKTEEESFKVLKGSVPVLVSCPHSIDQIRKGMLKPREVYSGAICKLIQERTDCFAIYKYHNNGIDDNFVLHTNYIQKIGELIRENDIKLLIDIHGMVGSKSKRFRGYYVELGTNDGRNLLDKIYLSKEFTEIFNKHGVDKVVTDKQFRASKSCTISKYVARTYKTPSIQIEISGDFRNALNYEIENVEKLLDAFEDIVDFVSNLN